MSDYRGRHREDDAIAERRDHMKITPTHPSDRLYPGKHADPLARGFAAIVQAIDGTFIDPGGNTV